MDMGKMEPAMTMIYMCPCTTEKSRRMSFLSIKQQHAIPTVVTQQMEEVQHGCRYGN